MSSLLTNTSAMTALQTLKQVNKDMATTQNRIATGQRVASAADNAAYWAIASGMKSTNSALSAVQDALGMGRAVVDTAATALNEAIKLAGDIQDKLVAKGTPGADVAIIDAEIAEITEQIQKIAQNATFEGINLLKTGGSGDQNIVVAYNDGVVDKMTVAAYDLEAALDGLDAAADPTADLATIKTAMDAMRTNAAAFGSASKRIESQQSFTSALMDAIDRGIGQLVDADMEKESARLAALQTQQQLGIQALSIANSGPQNILQLFRG